MKDRYIEEIDQYLMECEDIVLLDLILKLLQKSIDHNDDAV